jgi:hypothetical protein
VSATCPRDRFTGQSAKHENAGLGTDVSGDVSGVNNDEFSFTVEPDPDTGDAPAEGDAVLVEYPTVDSPSEPDECEVEVAVNEAETATATVTVE